jgi:hypothetical protein
MVNACLPLVFIILSTLVWALITIKKKNKTFIKNYNVGTILVLLFVVHPALVSSALLMVGCKEMEGGKQYLTSDYSIECWTDEHSHYALYWALPVLVVWGAGIPSVAWWLVHKNRDTQDELETKIRFIYFFNGYKKRFYMWEFVILWRKLAVIFASVMLANESFTLQCLVAILILILFMIL